MRGMEAPQVCRGTGVWPGRRRQHGAHRRVSGVETGAVARSDT
jgi:hypothetical protein